MMKIIDYNAYFYNQPIKTIAIFAGFDVKL